MTAEEILVATAKARESVLRVEQYIKAGSRTKVGDAQTVRELNRAALRLLTVANEMEEPLNAT